MKTSAWQSVMAAFMAAFVALNLGPVFGDSFLRVSRAGQYSYYKIDAEDSLTFPSNLKGYQLAIAARGAKDTLPPASVDSFRVVNVKRLAAFTAGAGPLDRFPGPLSISLPDSLLKYQPLRLVEIKGRLRTEVPCQLEKPGTLWWLPPCFHRPINCP